MPPRPLAADPVTRLRNAITDSRTKAAFVPGLPATLDALDAYLVDTLEDLQAARDRDVMLARALSDIVAGRPLDQGLLASIAGMAGR